MSTVNVQPTANARSAVAYALYGTSGDRYQRFEDEDKDTRTKWYTCSMGEPKEIVARAEQVGAAFHRRNGACSIVCVSVFLFERIDA